MVSATLEQHPAARFAALGGIGLDRAFGDSLPQQPWDCALPTDVVETTEELRFVMEVPGIRAQDIEVSVEDGILSVVAEKAADQAPARYQLAERRTGRFTRRFRLPRTVDSARVQATCANGVLTIRVPRAEAARARRIEVGAAAPAGGTSPAVPSA